MMRTYMITAEISIVIMILKSSGMFYCRRWQQKQRWNGVLASAWSPSKLSTAANFPRRLFGSGSLTFSNTLISASYSSSSYSQSSTVVASVGTKSSDVAAVTEDGNKNNENFDENCTPGWSDPSLRQTNFGGIDYWDTRELSKSRVIFVLGGPGAGKGTQSELLKENGYPIRHLSAGELLRAEVAKPDSPQGALIESYLVGGKIVPVEISLQLLREAMEQTGDKQTVFLVDGFPRNFDNLDGWMKAMAESSVVRSVLFYVCPLDVLQERILARGQDSGRSDDNLEALKKRFDTFERETVPVVDRLVEMQQKQPHPESPSWSVSKIAGDRDLEDVWKDSKMVLDGLIRDDVISCNAALLEAIRTKNVELYDSLTAWEGQQEHEVDEAKTKAEKSFENEGFSPTSDNDDDFRIQMSDVSNASVDVVDGQHVTVRYDIVIQGENLQETRQWAHKGPCGWQNIHFCRMPKSD